LREGFELRLLGFLASLSGEFGGWRSIKCPADRCRFKRANYTR
jgi:hypothetical protein